MENHNHMEEKSRPPISNTITFFLLSKTIFLQGIQPSWKAFLPSECDPNASEAYREGISNYNQDWIRMIGSCNVVDQSLVLLDCVLGDSIEKIIFWVANCNVVIIVNEET